MQAALPSFRFDSAALPPAARFPCFRDAMDVVMDVAPDGAAPAFFGVRADIRRLGRISVNSSSTNCGLKLERCVRRARTDGLDHYVVVLARTGGCEGEAAGARLSAPPGGVYLLDMARPWSCVVPPGASASFAVPRDALDSLLPGRGGWHGTVVRDAAGRLLTDFLASLELRLRTLTAGEAPFVERGALNLIAACLAPSGERAEQAGEQVAQALRIAVRRAVDVRLSDPELSPDDVARAVGASRSALYRLFEPEGGVAAFIRSRRLRAAGRMLADPAERRRIATVAFACGFRGEAQFSRAFRREFGLTASEVRAAGMPGRAPSGVAPDGPRQAYARWMWERGG